MALVQMTSVANITYADEIPAVFLADHGQDFSDDRAQWSVKSFRYGSSTQSPRIYIREDTWRGDTRIALFKDVVAGGDFEGISFDLALEHNFTWYTSQDDMAAGFISLAQKIKRLYVNMASRHPSSFVRALSSISISIYAENDVSAPNEYSLRMEMLRKTMRRFFVGLVKFLRANPHSVLTEMEYEIIVTRAPHKMFSAAKTYALRPLTDFLYDLRDDFLRGYPIRWTSSQFLVQLNGIFYTNSDSDQEDMVETLDAINGALLHLADKLQSGDALLTELTHVTVHMLPGVVDTKSYMDTYFALRDMMIALYLYAEREPRMITSVTYRLELYADDMALVAQASYSLGTDAGRQAMHDDYFLRPIAHPAQSPHANRRFMTREPEPEDTTEDMPMWPQDLQVHFEEDSDAVV